MCYGMGCGYESYPYGYNEGCVCRLPWHATCPFDREEEAESDEYEDEDEDCEDEYMPRRRLDGEEKYWPEWAFRRV